MCNVTVHISIRATLCDTHTRSDAKSNEMLLNWTMCEFFVIIGISPFDFPWMFATIEIDNNWYTHALSSPLTQWHCKENTKNRTYGMQVWITIYVLIFSTNSRNRRKKAAKTRSSRFVLCRWMPCPRCKWSRDERRDRNERDRRLYVTINNTRPYLFTRLRHSFNGVNCYRWQYARQRSDSRTKWAQR